MQSSISILLLASSVMRGGRCVAGKVVDPRESGLAKGQWIRLVSPHDYDTEKAIPEEWAQPYEPSPTQISLVEVTLINACPTDSQPENWTVELQNTPRLLETWDCYCLPNLSDERNPGRDDSGPRTLRPHNLTGQSLLLYRVSHDASVIEYKQTYPIHRTRYRLRFRDESDNWHSADIKDRMFFRRHLGQCNDDTSSIVVPSEFYMVMSLTEVWKDGLHYKIAATIFA